MKPEKHNIMYDINAPAAMDCMMIFFMIQLFNPFV